MVEADSESKGQQDSWGCFVAMLVVGALLLYWTWFALGDISEEFWRGQVVEHGAAGEAWVTSYRMRQDESSSLGGQFTVYYPEVAYEYEVDGQRYEQEETLRHHFYQDRAEAEKKLVERFGEQQRVTVYYDPDSPGFATVSRHWPPLTVTLMSAGFWLAAGLVGFVFTVAGVSTVSNLVKERVIKPALGSEGESAGASEGGGGGAVAEPGRCEQCGSSMEEAIHEETWKKMLGGIVGVVAGLTVGSGIGGSGFLGQLLVLGGVLAVLILVVPPLSRTKVWECVGCGAVKKRRAGQGCGKQG